MGSALQKDDLDSKGYTIVKQAYTTSEIDAITALIESKKLSGQFGLRAFLFQNPDVKDILFNANLLRIIKTISPTCTKLIKSIYFDKPPTSNWIVNWHQDLTINLSNKADIPGYKNWRAKDDRVTVQPNREFLENIFTIRIHLDDTTRRNGALRVIEKSHKQGIIPIKHWTTNKKGKETICEVDRGGALIMRPLLLHSSRRTENDQHRRVIHIEFTDQDLPSGLEWYELIEF